MVNDNKLLIIGDVHGKFGQYEDIIENYSGRSIQVGDFGFKLPHEWHLENVNPFMHKINFGNHDDYSFLNYIRKRKNNGK